MGCIAHGRKSYVYTILDSVKQGSNATLEVLHRVINDTYVNEGGKLPPKLYLQLDNTVKQCKNKYVLGYCAWLVHFGVFQEITISFLPVGHTHEDIDQMFSCISKYLSSHDAPSRLAFGEAVKRAFHNKESPEGPCTVTPEVVHLDRLANISDYMKPFLCDYPNITNWHQFRVFARGAGPTREVRCKVREWIALEGHRTWVGLRADEVDSPVFGDTDDVRSWLKCGPFGGAVRVPVSQRTAKLRKQKEKDRLRNDVEKMIAKRHLPEVHAQDLRDCVDKCTAEAEVDPLEFDWETDMYDQLWELQEDAPDEEAKERENEALADAILHHPIGSFWVVRSDFADNDASTVTATSHFFWLCEVVGSPFVDEASEGRDIGIPIRWWEKVDNPKKSDDTFPRYERGELRDDLDVKDLQVRVQLTAAARKNKRRSIKKHCHQRVAQRVAAWKALARGEYADSDSDD